MLSHAPALLRQTLLLVPYESDFKWLREQTNTRIKVFCYKQTNEFTNKRTKPRMEAARCLKMNKIELLQIQNQLLYLKEFD